MTGILQCVALKPKKFECTMTGILQCTTRGFECTLNWILQCTTRGFECTLNRILLCAALTHAKSNSTTRGVKCKLHLYAVLMLVRQTHYHKDLQEKSWFCKVVVMIRPFLFCFSSETGHQDKFFELLTKLFDIF